MEATRYFERTLFYDCSISSIEHYKKFEQRIFELDPSKSRLTVCVQVCGAETPTDKSEGVSTLLKSNDNDQSYPSNDNRKRPFRQYIDSEPADAKSMASPFPVELPGRQY